MRRRLVFAPEARADLRRLSAHIAKNSGTARAAAFAGRIVTRCFSPTEFPERCATSFERRVTMAFTIRPYALGTVRVLHGGRDLEKAFDA